MDNQRLILLLVFSFSLVMLWDAWQKQEQPKPVPSVATTPQNAASSANSASIPGSVPPSGAPALPAAGSQRAAQPSVAKIQVKTDLFDGEISAQGGELIRLELTKYRGAQTQDKKFLLFDDGAQHIYEEQSGLIGPGLPSHKTLYQLPVGESQLKAGEDTLRVRLVAETGNDVKVYKTYTFHRGSYLIDVSYEIVNGGAAPLNANAYFQTIRDGKSPDSDPRMVSTFTGAAVYTDQDKYQKVKFADIADGKAKHAQKADNGWIAMVQHYFVSAWIPQTKTEREFFTRKLADDLYGIGVIVPVASVAPGATGTVSARLYAGPQEQEKLAQVAPGLDLVVDYGWLTIIAAPLFWVLQFIHHAVGNWGWAIIALTVLLKLIFFPLSAASYKSMAKMKLVTPKLAKLKEQFAGDRTRLNQEMMELYKREKINPLGGCLPIVVQIPVFIALYWVLLSTVEMRDAPWLGWIHDLSVRDPYFILPLLMGVTMLVQTRLNPAPPDPIQAKVMMIMPIVFTGMFLFSPSGLVLYWTVNNLLSIAQQWQITRLITGGKKPA